MRNAYFILGLCICLLYYLVFKYKYDRQWKTLAYVISIGGIIISIGRILEEQTTFSKSLITQIIIVPVYVTIFLIIVLISRMAWLARKDSRKRYAVYIWFVTLAFLIVGYIIVFVLSRLGFYD